MNIHTPTARKWSLALFFLLGSTILLQGYAKLFPYGVRYVRTASIPTGLYGSSWLDHRPLERGQGVCFKFTPSSWFAERNYFPANANICKYVLGIPGDEVRPNGTQMQICHAGQCTNVGEVLPTDRTGRPTHGAFTTPVVIPAGQYYLGSTYSTRSFDSRYIGLIDARTIDVRITPIWTNK
jgi:type IV secretory pathway protease TraF